MQKARTRGSSPVPRGRSFLLQLTLAAAANDGVYRQLLQLLTAMRRTAMVTNHMFTLRNTLQIVINPPQLPADLLPQANAVRLLAQRVELIDHRAPFQGQLRPIQGGGSAHGWFHYSGGNPRDRPRFDNC